MRKTREVTPPLDTDAKITAALASAPQDVNTRIRRVLEVTVDKLDWIANGGLKQAGRPEKMREVKEALRLLRDVGRHTLALDKPKSPSGKASDRRATKEHTP